MLRYRPLSEPNHEIRLLCIPRRNHGTTSEALVNYALFHASLDDSNTKYQALSYTWGDPTLTKEISINNQSIHVTENLSLALRNLQRDDEDIICWSDAVCINQSDAVEKTQQVQLMREIYRRAMRVIIWLGPSTVQTDYTMQETNKLGDQLLKIGLWDLTADDIFRWSEQTTDENSPRSRTKMDVTKLIKEHLELCRNGEYPFWWTMSDIGERQWFKRIWCVQECANAHIAVFRCGQEEVDSKKYWAVALYSQLFNSYAMISQSGHVETDWKVTWVGSSFTATFPTELIGIRRKTLVSGGHDLMTLLEKLNTHDSSTSKIGATEPRDRVYALLGIANDDAAEEIVADYTISCEETFINTARVLLNHGHDDILSLCRKRGRCKDLPSWVPDWAAENRKPWSTWNRKRLFNASGASSIIVKESSNPRGIIVDGAFIDIIKEVGQVWSMGIEEKFDWPSAHKVFNDISKYLSHSSKYTQEQKKRAEWSIPIGDLEVTDVTSQITRTLPNSYMENAHALMKLFASERASEDEVQENRRSYALYISQMERMHNSRPFISETGYVGLVPMESTSGDSVVILMGARVPYVVRHRNDSKGWRLVGEAHVYGIMDGEFIEHGPVIKEVVLY
ncbi:HET-domain-containing protein [Lojkania enalia]|uniref:HET-domain-containing protein n=1 Tax=Lojkania enalia TaxID=147567 RepID=A0A9P4NA96_9PLEO|nr:HET-domain-containing protein [Didymosphaeria enalia]